MGMFVDAYMTEEQLALQKLTHEFAEKEIRPISMELDHQTDPAKSAYMDSILKRRTMSG